MVDLKAKEPTELSTHELIHVLWDRMAQNHQQYEGRDERLWLELEKRLENAIERQPGTPAMTPEQEAHLKFVKGRFCIMVDAKYRKGQAEHGGDLFRVSPYALCTAALEEAVDQVVYLSTMRDQISPDPVRDFLDVEA